jgi:glycosyltransferase involved in cell wall biosynthesis
VVHTHLFGGDVWGRLAAKSLDIPIVTTEHGFNREEHFVKHFMRWLLRNYSDQYIVPSHVLKNFLITQGGITKPVEVVPHGVEMKRFNKIRSLDFSKPFRLVMIGRLVKQKGFNLALSALAALQDIDWNVTIVGSGSEKKALQKLSQLLRIQSRVLFVDAQERVEDILQDQHILIVPSRSAEGLGIVAMEGMCAGRFVLVSMVEGLVEVVKSDMYGLRFKANDSNDLKKKLLWCFNHPEDVMSVAKKGREYAQQHFDVSSMVGEYEKIYFKLAKSRASLP